MRVWIWLKNADSGGYLAAKRKASRSIRFLLLTINLLLAAALLTEPRGRETISEAFLREDKAVVELPILMYHSILKDESRAGSYVISPAELESDLAWLRDNGFETIVMQDLIAYVHDGAALPMKPVMLTFDDGHYNNMTYALPLLQKYHMKAVVSVVVDYCRQYSEKPDPNPNYAYLNWEDLKALTKSGCFEVQSHSYRLHTQSDGRKGANKKPGESEAAYRELFLLDAAKAHAMLEQYCGITVTAYTYPFGEHNPISEACLKEAGYAGSFSCREYVNHITTEPDCLFLLGRFNRPHNKSAEELLG